jgi:hypothetical protein
LTVLVAAALVLAAWMAERRVTVLPWPTMVPSGLTPPRILWREKTARGYHRERGPTSEKGKNG